MTNLRQLHLRGALGAVQTKTYDGREHLVVPVVALMEGVIHAVNANHPERVTTATLAKAASSWNGRPLVLGHPTRDGRQISANDPTVMASHAFGTIFNSRMSGNKLVMDALVDPVRAEKIGGAEFLERLRKGEGCEVSVGAFVTTDSVSGHHNGKHYKATWLETTGDHLAMLPDGIGACNAAMGCGANRAAMRVCGDALELETLSNPEGINQYSHGGAAAAHDEATKAHTEAYKHPSETNARKAAELSDKASEHSAMTESDKGIRLSNRASQHADDAHAYASHGKMSSARKEHDNAASMHERASAFHGHRAKTESGMKHAQAKGLSMNLKSLRERMLALFDTPEQQQSEEDAELVKWEAMRATHDALGDAWDEVDTLIDELIEAEAAHVTGSAEDAESEIETAKLDAIRMHLYSMSGSISAMITAAYPVSSVAPSRYMEEFRAAYGKTISAATMKKVQGAHDASHDMHNHTVALGAECNGMKVMAGKMTDCPTCDGTGQITKDKKQQDCAACDGTGQVPMKAAEAAHTPCSCEEGQMTKAERIAALLKHEHNTVKDLKTLETVSEEFLTILENQATANGEQSAKHAAELKAAQDKQVETDAKLKAAEAAQIPAEELVTLRALGAAKQAADTAEKVSLITKLVAASKALTKEQLETKTLDDLKTLAAFAKIETVDYSIKGIPTPRVASAPLTEYAPPDPYAAELKALKAVN